jgi:orotidine-5'-phosphate decarboxylase
LHNRKRLIIALDMDDSQKALKMVDLLKSRVEFFKVGMELFYSSGGDIIKEIKDRGCKVFLDLKLHDIPNTVAKAAKSLTRFKPDIINVHASGGPEMMKAAAAAIREEAERLSIPCPAIIAVTVLTSINQDIFTQLGNIGRVEDLVVNWAKLTKDCGLDGVVASPGEVAFIREACGPDFMVVTPGVRPDWAEAGDQKRFTTPAMAIKSGATYIVVGRPVTSHPEPFQAAERILGEIAVAVS